MQVQRVQYYNNKFNLQDNINNKKTNINFTALKNVSTGSKKGCGFIMAVSIATVMGTIAAPIMTYNYLSENKKENSTFVNVLAAIGSGIATFGAGCAYIFHTNKKMIHPKN